MFPLFSEDGGTFTEDPMAICIHSRITLACFRMNLFLDTKTIVLADGMAHVWRDEGGGGDKSPVEVQVSD